MTLPRFGFVKANWHADIVSRALDGFCEIIPGSQVDVFDVPGALSCHSFVAIWPPQGVTPLSLGRRWSLTAVSIAMTLLRKRLLTALCARVWKRVCQFCQFL